MILVACSEVTTTPVEEKIITEEPVYTVEPTEGPSEEPVIDLESERRLIGTINIWHSLNEFEVGSLEDVVASFQEMHPDVQFNILYVPPYEIHNRYYDAVSSGGGPSILFGSPEWGPKLFNANLIADLSDLISEEFLANINPVALSGVQYKNRLIGLPYAITGVVLFRNSNIIPEAPADFDNLVEVAQSATSGGVLGAYLDYGLFYSAGHLYGVGGRLMDDEGNPAFNDETGVEWLEMIKRFKEAGPVESNEDNDVNLFMEGKVGMIIEGFWKANLLREAIGIENLAVDPWPLPMSGYVQTNNIYLNSNVTNIDLEACWAFMEFMLSTEAQIVFSEPDKAGRIPATMGVEVADLIQQQALLAFANGTAFPILPEMSAYWEPMDDALLTVMELGTDPAEALETAYDAVLEGVAKMRGE